MVRRIRWVGVILGAVTTVALGAILLAFVSLVLDPFLLLITSTGSVNGVTSITVTQERVRGLLLLLSITSAVFLALLVGGSVAGRLAATHAGLNGGVVGIVLVAVPFVWLLGSLTFVFLEPITGYGDAYGRSENLGMLGAALIVYCVVSPVFILASFLGGRLGGRSGRGNVEVDLHLQSR